MKNKFFKGQIAIEYLLLLTICALVFFLGFRTFFEDGGQVSDVSTNYFAKVQNAIVGDKVSDLEPAAVFNMPECEDAEDETSCEAIQYCSWLIRCEDDCTECETLGCRYRTCRNPLDCPDADCSTLACIVCPALNSLFN